MTHELIRQEISLKGRKEEEAHIEENLAIADAALPNSLTRAECDLVEAAARKYKELMKVGCTGCGYCLPCPEDVMIPQVFAT